MDRLNEEWLGNRPNFYFRYKRILLESMIEGTCLNVGCGSHLIDGATNVDEGLPVLPYLDNSFDTVICSDVLEHIGAHKQALGELFRVARRKVIITVPAYQWLFGAYDVQLGHKRRYAENDFSGFETRSLFWFLVPLIFLRKILSLKHRPLPEWLDSLFFKLSRWHFPFGTTILAVKKKFPQELMSGHKISFFVPIFNEERILERDIRMIDFVIRRLPLEYEIFVVNDASRDKTAVIAQKIEKLNRKVTLLRYDIGPTRRENLAKSFRDASGDIIVFVDVDLVTSLRFLPDLLEPLLKGCDIVTGSRYVRGAKIKRKPFRFFISVIYNFLIRLFFCTGVDDHMCGFKAMKREAAISLVEEMGYDTTLKRGIFWDTELLVRARRKGLKIMEIPIWWRERNKTALYFSREILAARYAWSFFWKMRLEHWKNREKTVRGGA